MQLQQSVNGKAVQYAYENPGFFHEKPKDAENK